MLRSRNWGLDSTSNILRFVQGRIHGIFTEIHFLFVFEGSLFWKALMKVNETLCFSFAPGQSLRHILRLPLVSLVMSCHLVILRALGRQEGQDGVDQGGWSFAVDDLSSKGAVQRCSFSCPFPTLQLRVFQTKLISKSPKTHLCFQDMHDWSSFQVAYQDISRISTVNCDIFSGNVWRILYHFMWCAYDFGHLAGIGNFAKFFNGGKPFVDEP